MKTSALLCGLMATFALCAETTITVNDPLTGTLTDAQTITVKQSPTITEDAVLVVKTKISFTIPDESPAYADVTAEKLVLAVDTNGTVLIADGKTQKWVASKVVVTEDDVVEVEAKGYLKDNKLTFDVKLNNEAPITVTAPATTTSLSAVELVGEGSVDGITLALVDTAVLPSGGNGEGAPALDNALVQAYMAWVTNVLQGKMPGVALPEGVNPEDAFVMNVAGKPELKIEHVDPVNGTITLVGKSTAGDNTTTVSLENINGKIYISWTESLSGEVTVTEASVKERSTEKFILNWPAPEARFIKAAVSREAPVAPASL
ncbi:MAG: hypothetical protein IKT85_03005 [Kiritimatiellae bacterium]|nr:hypothetical protein [Kiritimatiellia bacterium]